MLENLGKTVIVTGSQIPIFEIRSDGRDNFLGALIVAGSYCIPEVCVFFNNKLYRGNRTVKRSNGSLDAFDSPNLTPLAHFGIDVHGKQITSVLNCKFIVDIWDYVFQWITDQYSDQWQLIVFEFIPYWIEMCACFVFSLVSQFKLFAHYFIRLSRELLCKHTARVSWV